MNLIRELVGVGQNEQAREAWVEKTLGALPRGWKILDAGTGTTRHRKYCAHLAYTSRDFCQYDGTGDGRGLHTHSVDHGRIDIVSDIAAIPVPDASFDTVLRTEVLEHVPDPVLGEFGRIVRPGGRLIVTAPFASHTHIAPYSYATGFSRYWYEHHRTQKGFRVDELSTTGDWYGVLRQELTRLPSMSCSRVARLALETVAAIGVRVQRRLSRDAGAADLACFRPHCVTTRT
ncbi:MAG: class I SAM-dependent methyltransferase [Deltaproteobacteria bacterium]|jgi:SAM-dependent methyltransferase